MIGFIVSMTAALTTFEQVPNPKERPPILQAERLRELGKHMLCQSVAAFRGTVIRIIECVSQKSIRSGGME